MARKKKTPTGPKPFAQALMQERGPVLVSPRLLSKVWFISVRVVEDWIKDEVGVTSWVRKNHKGNVKTYYRLPMELAESIRLKHVKGGRDAKESTRAAARV